MRFAIVVHVLAFVGAAAPAGAGERSGEDLTRASELSRPPDLRRGERLDGRSPPERHDPGREALRLVATPVRAGAWLILAPVNWTIGWIERKQIPRFAYEAATSDDRLIGVRPLVRYEPGYAVGAGLRYFDMRSLGAGSLVEAAVRGGARSLESHFALEPPGALGLRLALGFTRRNDFIFGGTEGETRADLRARGLDVVRYSGSTASAAASWRRALGGGPLTFDLTLGVERRLYGNGIDTGSTPPIHAVYCLPDDSPGGSCIVDPSLVPGFASGLRLLRAGAGLTLDTRPVPRFGGGFFATMAGSWAQGYAGDPSRHVTAIASAGATVPFGDRSLEVRVRGGLVEPLGSAPIPFEELLSPSGLQGLRGVARGRLRGPTELVATVEYRWLLSPALDAILFVDRGNAFGRRFDGLSWSRTFTTAGFGVMLLSHRSVDLRASVPVVTLQVAFERDDRFGGHFSFVANGF